LNPNVLNLPSGGSAQATLTLKSVQGFSGTIQIQILRSDGTPASGFTIDPAQANLPANQQINVLVTISAASTVSSGFYSLKIRASAGNLVREAGLTATVPPPEQVTLPPVLSGQGFPQPPMQVGSVPEGASLFAADRLTKIVISPSSVLIGPGESRDLAVWVEDESGNRYAADSSYLQLKVAGNSAYQVQWAGPATLRVQAPSTYVPEALFINVTRPSFTPGSAFLNGIATVTMAQYKPEVVIIPEERIGFPVSYELDEPTVQARFAPFMSRLVEAVDLDSSDGQISIPALVREDPNQPIQEGMWIAGEGEAAILAGRVQRIVTRSNDGVLLLAIEPAMPWEIYSDYQTEVDYGQIVQQGVLPLDPSRISLGEIQIQTLGPQGYTLTSLSGDKCELKEPEIGGNLDLGQYSNISLENLWLETSLSLSYECDWGKFGASLGVTVKLGVGKLIFAPNRVKIESSTVVEGELKLFINMPLEVREEDDYKYWLANMSVPIPVPIPAVDLALEMGLLPTNFSNIAQEDEQGQQFPDNVEVFSTGIRGGFAANLIIDSAMSPPVDSSFSRNFSLFAESPFIGLSTTPGDWSWTVSGDLLPIGIGFVVGAGGKALSWALKLLKLLGISVETDKTILGASVTLTVSQPSEWSYVTMKKALTGGARGENVDPGHFNLNRRIGALARLRGALVQAIARGLGMDKLGPLSGFISGASTSITLVEVPAVQIDPSPVGSLVKERMQDSIKVSGRFALDGARATEIRAYRLSDVLPSYNSNLQPIAVANPTNDTFAIYLPIPTNCGSAPPEGNTAVLGVWFGFWSDGPRMPLGWTYLGMVDLCAPFNLAVPALRGFVGSEVSGNAGLRYLYTQPKIALIDSSVVSSSPTMLDFNGPERKEFTISYTCQEPGSYVGRVTVMADGRNVADAPALVSCIPDGDRNASNNPGPDQEARRSTNFFGDPHLITPDGAAYDFHAAGEFWAVLHPSLSFQLRFKKMPGNPEATYISRLGAKLGSAIVEVFPTPSWQYENDFLPKVTLTILVNGQDMTGDLNESGVLQLPNDTYIAVHRWANVLVNGILVDRRPLEVALIFGGDNARPAVLAQADKIGPVFALAVGAIRPGFLAGQLKGLMGNGNGDPADDFATRNGDALTSPLGFGTLYQVFGRSWEVGSGERYFTDVAPQFSYPLAPPGMDPEQRNQCAAYCAAIQDPYLREACILDGVASGDCAGAAAVATAMEQDRSADGQSPPQNSTRPALLGLSPSYLQLIPGGQGTLVVAHPYSNAPAVTYRLRLIGEGPGMRVDGTLLTDNQTSAPYSLQPTESRSHTLTPVCDQEDHAYLIQAVEEEATESRSALIWVTCNIGFNLSISPNTFQLFAPGGAVLDLTLSPYGGFTGEVTLSVTDDAGNPMPQFTITPDRVTITGATDVRRTATLRVSASASPGSFSLKLRATSGNISAEAPFTASISISDVATQWTVRAYRKYSIAAFLNGKYAVIPTFDSVILTSDDGLAYEGHHAGITFSGTLHAITYGNETYVAVGDNGVILTSPDLIFWAQRNSGTSAHLYDVTYGAGIFVAVGAGGTILTSRDGLTWMPRSSPVTHDIPTVAYGNNMFVSVTRANLLTSSDGITWEALPKPFSRPDYIQELAFGGGRFVVVGEGTDGHGYGAMSPDGLNWSQNLAHFYPIYAVTYGDGSFFALTSNGNLLQWDPQNGQRGVTNLDSGSQRGLAYGNGKLLAATYTNLTLVEFDSQQNPVVKPIQPLFSSSCWMNKAAYANGVFLVGANNQTTYTSPDGVLWDGPSSVAGCSSGGSTSKVAGLSGDENGRFVMVTNYSEIYTSGDGLNWQLKKPAEPNVYLLSVAYAGGQFVAAGTKILISTDGGETWMETLSSLGCPGTLLDVVYGNGKWVAVGGQWPTFTSQGCVYTSSDGTNWTLQTLPSGTTQLTAVAFGNGLFVAVGLDGAIYTSTDGAAWTRQSFRNTTADFTDVAFGNGTFIITKSTGTYSEPKGFFVISHDGIVWTEIENPFFRSIDSVAYGNGRWVAIGGSLILTSP